MIQYFITEHGKLTEQNNSSENCWINVSPPISEEEISFLAENFDILPDYIHDSLDIEERARYEREDDYRFLLMLSPVLNDVEREDEPIFVTAPIGFILLPDKIITISPYANPVLEGVINHSIKITNLSDQNEFVLKIMQSNVFKFLRSLKKLNIKRNNVESKLYFSSRNRELKQLLSIEKSLVYLVDALSSNELLKMKIKRSDFLNLRGDEAKEDLFEDISIDNSQALAMANLYTNILNGTMEAYASIISNNLNIVIHRLTLITILLMVPTLIASFFGMNIPNGFEGSDHAFMIILGISVLLTLLVTWYLRRNRLL